MTVTGRRSWVVTRASARSSSFMVEPFFECVVDFVGELFFDDEYRWEEEEAEYERVGYADGHDEAEPVHLRHGAGEECEEGADGRYACCEDRYACLSDGFVEGFAHGLAVSSVVPVRVEDVHGVVDADADDECCDAPCEGAEWYAEVSHGAVEPDDAEEDDDDGHHGCSDGTAEQGECEEEDEDEGYQCCQVLIGLDHVGEALLDGWNAGYRGLDAFWFVVLCGFLDAVEHSAHLFSVVADPCLCYDDTGAFGVVDEPCLVWRLCSGDVLYVAETFTYCFAVGFCFVGGE